ncbi:MAG: SAM-dependent methyltransferase [Thermoleophilaceae bacterium]|nr:SAM-dependent methyltransferase [Thermoleophilaceae bacterium]
MAHSATILVEPALPAPRWPGVSRTALAALQAHALAVLASPSRADGIALPLYVAAAERGHEHLEAAADAAIYRAAVRAGALPGPGRVTRVAARKRWIAQAAEQAIAEGVPQVVVLGAGFDTLGVRLLKVDPDLVVVELDRPATLAAKARALASATIPRPWPRFAAADLNDAPALPDALVASGWRLSAPTLFVAEVVLEYLAPDSALAVLAELADLAAPRSRVVCTARFGDAAEDHLAAATAAAGEPMRFRPTAGALPGLLHGAGFEVLAHRGRAGARSGAGALLLLAAAPPGRR